MRTLVRLSDEAKAKATNQSSTSLREKRLEVDSASFGRLYLTEDEIAGNLFIFTAAGFDTTSNTLGYAITLLAVYPEWQNWIQAEIDAVLRSPQGGQSKDASLPDYSTAFPKLVRCLAVMVRYDLPLLLGSSMILKTLKPFET